MNRFKRYEPEPDPRSQQARERDELDENGQFALERRHERRIISWSPDPDEDFTDDPPPPAVEEIEPPAPVAPQRPAVPAAIAPVQPVQPPPQPWPVEEHVVDEAPAREHVEPIPVELAKPAAPKPSLASHPPQQSAAGQEPRRRGRPRGRPRRQVHFHVDPDEELLLLAASRKHGSQQKGLVAALQALQDIEVLRDEIERLRAECERQRVLLADAEAIFRR